MAAGKVIMSNKRYTEEFKIEAVRQVIDRGYSVAEVADRLGTTTRSLDTQKKKYGPDFAPGHQFPINFHNKLFTKAGESRSQ